MGYPLADDMVVVNSGVICVSHPPKRSLLTVIRKKKKKGKKSCHLGLNILKNTAVGAGVFTSNFYYLSEDAVMFNFETRKN